MAHKKGGGSTRNGRFGPTVAGWFAGHARRRPGVRVDVIDLAETGLPETLGDHDEPPPAPVRELAPRLAAADAFVVVTPEYNQSFPAPLKTALDWFYEEWAAKPVALVATILTAVSGCDKTNGGAPAGTAGAAQAEARPPGGRSAYAATPVTGDTTDLSARPHILYHVFGERNDPRILPVAVLSKGRIDPIVLSPGG